MLRLTCLAARTPGCKPEARFLLANLPQQRPHPIPGAAHAP